MAASRGVAGPGDNAIGVIKRGLCRERLRPVPPQFSWIDHRRVRDRHIAGRSAEALALYLFPVTVADGKLVALSEIYGPEHARRAIQDALEFQAFGCQYVANLLEQRPRRLPEPGARHLTRRQDLLELELPEPNLALDATQDDLAPAPDGPSAKPAESQDPPPGEPHEPQPGRPGDAG